MWFFRISNLAPRVLLLCVLALLLTQCLNPVLHLWLVRVGQQTTGGAVQIARVRWLWTNCSVQLEGAQVVDPKSPWRNLLEFSEGQFRLNAAALLRRRFVVEDAWLTDVQVAAPRRGAIQPQDNGLEGPAGGRIVCESASPLVQADWLEAATGGSDLLEDQLECLQVARLLTQQWPATYQELGQQAQQLMTELKALEAMALSQGDNPLRYVPAYQEASNRLTVMRKQIRQQHQRIETMREQIQTDRQTIDQARGRDLERLAQPLPIDNVDAAQLSDYLLRRDVAHDLQTWLTWIVQGRTLIADLQSAPPLDLTPGRGRNMLAGASRGPDYVIRRLALDGTGLIHNQAFSFVGAVENLTSQPQLANGPTRVHLSANGPAPLEVVAELNRSQPTRHDHLVINCPSVELPQRVLGEQRCLAINVAPGAAQVWLDVHLHGDQLSGEVRIKQLDVVLTARLAPDASSAANENLQLAVDQIRTLQTVAGLGGCLTRPTFEVQSNLGHELTQGMGMAIKRQRESYRQQLIQRLQELVENETARFDAAVVSAREGVLEQLAASERTLDSLQQEFASRLSDAYYIYPTDPPFDNLLRR